MRKKIRNLALMLARGGSKGLPGKNIKLLNNKPLLCHSAKAVIETELFDRFIISTDSEEISRVARDCGIEVPFKRPKELARDNSNALDAIEHALKFIEKEEGKYDYVLYVLPTSPLIIKEDILKAYKILIEKKADIVVSVTETDHPMFWMNTLKEDLSLKNFVPKFARRKNRQQLPKSYRISGAIYFGKWDVFYYKKDWFEVDSYAYILPRERAVDIDSEIDFELAEILLKRRKK